MEHVVITIDLHESNIKCQQEVMFIVADPERKSCHGIVTVGKVFDIDNERMNLVSIIRREIFSDACRFHFDKHGEGYRHMAAFILSVLREFAKDT